MKKQWWSKGVRFQCQGSGNCCVSRDEYGFVYLTETDSKKMAKHLGLAKKEFEQEYCDSTSGHLHLKEDPKRAACMFLKENKCSVYLARPTQCRTWPFWPELMSPKKWNTHVVGFCPGVDKGPIVPAKQIKEQLEAQRLADQ